MPMDTETLQEFFRDQIAKAQERRQVPLRAETQFYVVNLLSEFVDPKKLYEPAGAEASGEPIALTYIRAVQSPNPIEQFKLFRLIGDRTLYLSGFFSDSFKRKIVDVDYYISMGETAYGSASDLTKDQASKDVFTEVFEELSKKFVRLVDVLADISETTGVTTDSDLLRLYERWLITKSERLSEKLEEQGILPIDTSKGQLH